MWFSSPQTGRTMLTPGASAGCRRTRGDPRAERDGKDRREMKDCRDDAERFDESDDIDHPALLRCLADRFVTVRGGS